MTLPKKKMGRPTDGIKEYRVDVRMSKEDFETLEAYCKENNVLKPDAVRNWIKSLKK